MAFQRTIGISVTRVERSLDSILKFEFLLVRVTLVEAGEAIFSTCKDSCYQNNQSRQRQHTSSPVR